MMSYWFPHARTRSQARHAGSPEYIDVLGPMISPLDPWLPAMPETIILIRRVLV